MSGGIRHGELLSGGYFSEYMSGGYFPDTARAIMFMCSTIPPSLQTNCTRYPCARGCEIIVLKSRCQDIVKVKRNS